METEIVRVLDLRERLRVEEVFLEMQIDIEQLYVSPPIYHTALELLGNVRILIVRACQSLAYIQNECANRGLTLNIARIDDLRITNRPRDHPFYALSRYLRPSAWKDFNNFEHFEHQARVGDEVGHRAWDEILAVGEFVETDSESSGEPMQHDGYSLDFGCGRHGLPPTTKLDLPVTLMWSADDDDDDDWKNQQE